MNKLLINMRYELKLMAEKEALKLWRLARKAEDRGVSQEIINDIRREANDMHTNMTAYPDRLLSWDFEYNYKYAFKY